MIEIPSVGQVKRLSYYSLLRLHDRVVPVLYRPDSRGNITLRQPSWGVIQLYRDNTKVVLGQYSSIPAIVMTR